MTDVSFIVGSPRSGTTILANILNCHQEIAEWYEPYYLWERFFPVPDCDIWDASLLTPQIINKIRSGFNRYGRKASKGCVLDKLPTHSFNLAVLYGVFPTAKWIHIIRDGRDVTLSISKEWEKRARIVSNRDYRGLLRVAGSMLRRQPFWRYRIMAIRHEIATHASLSPSRYLNKSRWQGEIGWGPRFRGWQDYYQSHSLLEFNAMQWRRSVEAVQEVWPILPDSNKIEVRYEDLLNRPHEILGDILCMLGLPSSEKFWSIMPALKQKNYAKWRAEFSAQQLNLIDPVVSPLLEQLGYSI